MPQPIGPDYFYDVVSVSQPDLGPDGSRLAFVRSTVDRESAKTRAEVMLANMAGDAPRAFTNGPNDTLPRWSPDGERLAFLRQDHREHAQLWIAPAQLGEAHQVTTAPSSVTDYRWSPDGRRIVFQRLVDRSEEEPDAPDRPVVVTHLRYKADGTGLRAEAWMHLFVVELESGEVRQLTEGDYDHFGAAWSPDGRRIAFVSGRHASRDVEARTEAYVVSAEGGAAELRSAGLFAVGGLAWSPDGERLAAIATPPLAGGGGCSLVCQCWVYVLAPGEAPRAISDDSVRPATGAPFAPSGGELRWTVLDEIVFAGDARGQSYVCVAPVDGSGVRRLSNGGVHIEGWTADRNATAAVVAASSPSSMVDIIEIDLATGDERRLTGYNDDWLSEHPPASVEKFTFERDGAEVEARLVLPPDFDPAKKYPLVLDVHGGPHSVFYDDFYPLHQVPASAGYIVLAINPRGTGSYGRDFSTAVHGDWGDGPFADLMHGVDLVAQRPYVDETRIVMHGSSYGGYMGAWIAGHSDRFKAIVIAAPVTNLPSFYGTSDIGVHFSEIQLGAGRFDALDDYVRQSPLTYAPNVRTPVLIVHGEDDDRVPIEQGEQYFVALKRLGKEVELVRLPGSHHGLSRNSNLRLRVDYYERILDWFDRHLP